MSDKYDPALPPPPESIEVFTPEGNLALMTELVAQANEFKRKIAQAEKDVALWTRRLELARSQNDPALWEATEEELKKHKRALLEAQMELSVLEDKKANLKFQHRAPSAEQKFRTAQAQYLVNQFREMGIDPDGARLEKEFRIAAAEDELAALKQRAQASQALSQLAQQAAAPTASRPQGDLTPGDLRRGAALGKELLVKGKRYRRIDATNIGTPDDEKAHDLVSAGELQRIRLESTFPSGRLLADEGIGFSQQVSFRLSGFTPNQDVLLLFRIDVGQPHHVETAVDGTPLKTRTMEVDTLHRWRHETVLVPAEHVLMDDMIVSRTPKEGTVSNLYGAWAYQVEAPEGVKKATEAESQTEVTPIAPQAEAAPLPPPPAAPPSGEVPAKEDLPTLEELLADSEDSRR